MSELKWITAFAVVDNINRIFYGMYMTLLGPSQPYLAHAVGVDIDTFSWIQPFASIAALVGAVIAGLIFKSHVVTPRQKMFYLSFFTFLLCITSVLPLYTTSLWTLIFVISLRFFFSQMLEIPCQSLYVYTLGAEKSQAFIMLFHCTVGAGFLFGPVIIRPFFPEESSKERDEICNQTSHGGNDASDQVESVIESIKWPYWIMFYGHIACAIGYLFVLLLPFKMPVFPEENVPKTKSAGCCSGMALIVVIFYMASCGSERLFQSMEFTFGLCGPLKLTSKEAVITDDCYNGGFFAGRLASILAVKFMSPKLMLKLSVILCFFSTALLSWQGAESATLLYTCASIFGFAISWQFGSAYSWSAQHMDVVGAKASIFTIGCAMSFFAPMAGAYLFTKWTPMSVWHLNLTLVLGQALVFLWLHFVFKDNDLKRSESSYQYKELNQMEEINLSSDDDFEEK